VFLDETAATTSMVRRYGWAPRGERCRIAAPAGHWTTTTVIAGLRNERTECGRSPGWADDGRALPRLPDRDPGPHTEARRHGDPGQSRRAQGDGREAIEAAGARLLYLPSSSPDFNPIELAFAKLKALLRSAAARTVSDLWEAVREAFARFSPKECRNSFTAAGYEDDAYVPT
jgi:transposase